MVMDPALLNKKLDLEQSLNRIGNAVGPGCFIKGENSTTKNHLAWNRSYVTHRHEGNHQAVAERFRRTMVYHGSVDVSDLNSFQNKDATGANLENSLHQKKTRAKLHGLLQINDKARPQASYNFHITHNNRQQNLIISDQARPPSKFLGSSHQSHHSPICQPEPSPQTAGIPQLTRNLQNINQNRLPQLGGRHNSMNLEEVRGGQNSDAVKEREQGEALQVVEKYGDSQHDYQTVPGSTMNTSASNANHSKKLPQSRKKGRDQITRIHFGRDGAAAASSQFQGHYSPLKLKSLTFNNNMHVISDEHLLEQSDLENYSLMEQLSKSYKETGKLSVQVIKNSINCPNRNSTYIQPSSNRFQRCIDENFAPNGLTSHPQSSHISPDLQRPQIVTHYSHGSANANDASMPLGDAQNASKRQKINRLQLGKTMRSNVPLKQICFSKNQNLRDSLTSGFFSLVKDAEGLGQMGSQPNIELFQKSMYSGAATTKVQSGELNSFLPPNKQIGYRNNDYVDTQQSRLSKELEETQNIQNFYRQTLGMDDRHLLETQVAQVKNTLGCIQKKHLIRCRQVEKINKVNDSRRSAAEELRKNGKRNISTFENMSDDQATFIYNTIGCSNTLPEQSQNYAAASKTARYLSNQQKSANNENEYQKHSGSNPATITDTLLEQDPSQKLRNKVIASHESNSAQTHNPFAHSHLTTPLHTTKVQIGSHRAQIVGSSGQDTYKDYLKQQLDQFEALQTNRMPKTRNQIDQNSPIHMKNGALTFDSPPNRRQIVTDNSKNDLIKVQNSQQNYSMVQNNDMEGNILKQNKCLNHSQQSSISKKDDKESLMQIQSMEKAIDTLNHDKQDKIATDTASFRPNDSASHQNSTQEHQQAQIFLNLKPAAELSFQQADDQASNLDHYHNSSWLSSPNIESHFEPFTNKNYFISSPADLNGKNMSSLSIASQMIEHRENIPRMERLAQMDYVMRRINQKFKMQILDKYGLTKSDYRALMHSQDSLSNLQLANYDSIESRESQFPQFNFLKCTDRVHNKDSPNNTKFSPLNTPVKSALVYTVNQRMFIPQSQWMTSDKKEPKTKNNIERGTMSVPNKPHLGQAKRISLFHNFDIIPDEKDELRISNAQAKQKNKGSRHASPDLPNSTDQSFALNGSLDIGSSKLSQQKNDSKSFSNTQRHIGASSNQKPHASPDQNMSEKDLQVQEACQLIDNLMKQKILEEMRAKRKFKDPDMYKGRDEEMEKLIGFENLPSGLERKRVRELKLFRKKILLLQQQIAELKKDTGVKEQNQQQAYKLFKNLDTKELDPEVKKTTECIDKEAATFLGEVINDVYSTSERNALLKRLQDEMIKMIFDQMKFDVLIQHKIAVRKRKLQQQVLNQMMHEQKMNKKVAMSPVIAKLQAAVTGELSAPKPKFIGQGNSGKKKGGSELKKLLFGQGVLLRRVKPKIRNRLQKLIKKHFFNKPKNKLDLAFVMKLARLQEQLQKIFGEDGNLGQTYDTLRQNIWANQYLRDIERELQDDGVKFQINYEKANKGLIGFNMLFSDDVLKQKFYQQAKQFVRIDDTENDNEKIAQQNYFYNCIRKMEAPLPTFARLTGHCLFLTECRISETMSQALAEYLHATKDNPAKQIKQLIIDDCGMTDDQYAQILSGIDRQGSHIKQLVYSNNDLSYKSVEVIGRMIPHLREINFNNISRCYGKLMYNHLLSMCIEKGIQLQKLKLSNVNLNDSQVVNNLCQLLNSRPLLMTLDVSWSRLSSKSLNQLISSLNEKQEQTVRNLNISYNCLIQPPKDENAFFDEDDPNYEATEDFVDNLCEFMQKNELLYHLDISGMNLLEEQIIQISQAAVQCESLVAIHMSDNGIRADKELQGEILDIFGLSDGIFKDIQYKVNNPISNPKELKNIMKNYTKAQDFYEIMKQNKQIDANAYRKHLLQQRQSKTVSMNRIINQAQVSTGIGRTETSMYDDFILLRQINQPELIFNQCRYKDLYFEEDSSEYWHLQDQACGMTGGCHICRKHKYTLIFYQQEASQIARSNNEGLIEIKDKEMISQIKEEMNLMPQDEQDIAPFICGTVVNGGFSRKLRMLRADFYCMLSVSQCSYFVTDFKQIGRIKAGLLANLLKSQDLNGRDESVEYLKGWHRKFILDKTTANETTDMAVINSPNFIDPTKMDSISTQNKGESPIKIPQEPLPDSFEDCKTFVYAAYLPPGLHQFLIFCPKTQRAFCKDIIIDLNACDCWPEYPDPLRRSKDVAKKKKVTRQNVWRKWRDDSEEDIQMAFLADCSDSFNPELFIKNAEDVEESKKILKNNFQHIQVAYLEGLAGSPNSFPEISFECFITKMLEQQKSDQEKKRLMRAHMELAFIRATRGDDACGVQGTLCRGEFLEILLRMCFIRHPKCMVSDYLDDFLDIYVKQQYDSSPILPIRKEIRSSKKLNQLLFDNKEGLTMIYNEYCRDHRGFSLESARNLLTPLSPNKGEPFIKTFRELFVYSQQTNLNDLHQSIKYSFLEFVEFQEFICRVAKEFFSQHGSGGKGHGEEDGGREPAGGSSNGEIEMQVFWLLEMIWAHRAKNKPQGVSEKQQRAKKKSKKKDKKEFPELVPCLLEDDEDSD